MVVFPNRARLSDAPGCGSSGGYTSQCDREAAKSAKENAKKTQGDSWRLSHLPLLSASFFFASSFKDITRFLVFPAKKIHHGDTEGTERRRRRMLGLFFSVLSVVNLLVAAKGRAERSSRLRGRICFYPDQALHPMRPKAPVKTAGSRKRRISIAAE
jgi:hypothetical protein